MRAALLVLASLLLAAGLELLMQYSLPPIYPDQEMDLSADPTLIERGVAYTDASGRQVLKEEWHLFRFAMTFFLQLGILIVIFPAGLGQRMIRWATGAASRLKQGLRESRKRIPLLLGGGLLLGAVVFFLSRAWVKDLYDRQNWMVDWMCALGGFAAAALFIFFVSLPVSAAAFLPAIRPFFLLPL